MDQLLIPVEYREDESRASPGRLVGQLIVYEKRAKDRPEVFTRGSLVWPETGITLNLQHDRKSLLARTVPFVLGDEVRIDATMPNTGLGRDAIELVRTGTATGLSIEVQSRAEGRRGDCGKSGAPLLPEPHWWTTLLTTPLLKSGRKTSSASS